MQGIEDYLEEASDFTDMMPEEHIDTIVELAGSYVLQVAFDTFGGKFQWFDQRNQPILVVGEPEFHIAIITFDKIRARLQGGDDDDITYFYAGFTKRVREAKAGDRALYV